MSTVSERERFDFEREKWRAETAMRTREVSAKERDITASKWRSPLVVAVFAAAAAAMGNAVVAMVNGSQQVTLENSKAESARILEMTKTGNTEAAANNLKFLLAAGLIAEPDRVERVRAYLDKRAPGAGPALPAASGRVSFDPTDALNADVQGTLEGVLDNYRKRLDGLGLASADIEIKFQSNANWPISAYNPPGTIVIDPKMAPDHSVLLREYNHHVLLPKHRLGWNGHFAAIESGLADYLACSFLNNSRYGAVAAKVTNPDEPYFRNLANVENFSEFKARTEKTKRPVDPLFDGAKVWGALFWEMRSWLGRDVSDRIVVNAWREVTWPDDDATRPSAFSDALMAAAEREGPEFEEKVRGILMGRNFPLRWSEGRQQKG
jgi:hypothetical protein